MYEKKMFTRAFTTVACCVVTVSAIYGQEFRKPHELMDDAQIEQLESDFENAAENQDLSGLQERTEQLIASYTEQFASEKRIRDDIDIQGSLSERANVNTVRLFSLARSQTAQASFYSGESPFLFRLHVLLGKIHAKNQRASHALAQYTMALRYRSIETMPELSTVQEKENYYKSMLETYAEPDRISQSSENPGQAERFRELYEQYFPLKYELEELERLDSVADAERARGRPAPDRSADLNEARARFNGVMNEMEQIRTGPYTEFHNRRKTQTAELIYQCALIVKQLEEQNRKKEIAKNRNSKYRGTPGLTGARRTEVRSHPGFQKLLEWAKRIDPKNERISASLADEYRTSRQDRLAIAEHIRFLSLAEEKNLPGATLVQYRYHLAGLYTDTGEHLKAVETYETLLRAHTNEDINSIENPDPELFEESASAVRLHLAGLYFEKAGNFPRAKELYESALSELVPVADSNDPFVRARRYMNRYRTLMNLAALERRNRRSGNEKQRLADAKDIYLALSREKQQSETEIAALKSRMTEIKNSLRDEDNRELAREYYRLLNVNIPSLQRRLNFQKIRLDRMQYPALLEREAVLSLRNRDFRTAISHYNEIAETGSGPQAGRARQNIRLIRLSMEDGRMRQPVLPADYER